MKNISKLVIILLVVATSVRAQERSSVYTNLLNPFIYNPSLAGSNDNIYAIFNTRGIVGGIDGSGRSYNFGIHAPIKNNMGIGAKVISSSVGVFQTINVEGAYSKQVKLNSKNSLSLGLSLGFTQTNLKTELLNRQVDMSDPALNTKDLNKILFSSGVGLHYKYDKKVDLGLSFPSLMTGDRPLNDMMIVNAAYSFYSGTEKQCKLKPIVNFYKLNTSPNLVDALLQGYWKDMVSLTAGYRSNGSIIGAAGLNFKSFAISYAYYNYTSGINALAPAENEIAISFGFNKPKPTSKNEVVSDEVIQDEIDKLNERLNGLMSIEKTNPGMVNMKKEASKLNKDLVKVLGRYKITNQEQIQKIKSLQSNIESVIAKYND